MPQPASIPAPHLARLAGLSERHLLRLASTGWLPRPVRKHYSLVAAIQGLLRYYRQGEEDRVLQDTYADFESCAAATGIPVELLRRAKRQGCPALGDRQVQLGPFLRWWWASGQRLGAEYERERAEQVLLQNAKLRMTLRRLKQELVAADEVARLGGELGSAIRKVLTRLHRIAPSLEGRTLEVIQARLIEQEQDILAQLQILDDRLAAWQQAD